MCLETDYLPDKFEVVYANTFKRAELEHKQEVGQKQIFIQILSLGPFITLANVHLRISFE